MGLSSAYRQRAAKADERGRQMSEASNDITQILIWWNSTKKEATNERSAL